eukprot:scaffold2015_cov188-Prasinococcus_capsulatus_cf.AAC.1
MRRVPRARPSRTPPSPATRPGATRRDAALMRRDAVAVLMRRGFDATRGDAALMRRDATRCDAALMRCAALRCGAVRRDATRL